MANPRTSFFPLTHPNPEQKFVFDQPDEDIVTPLVPTGYRFDMKKVNIKQKPYDNYTAEQMQEIDKLIGRKSTTTTPVSNTMRNYGCFCGVQKFKREDANYVADNENNAANIPIPNQEDRVACENACLADPKYRGYTWFDTTTTSPKKCVGFPAEPYSDVPSTQHFSGTRR